MRFFAIIIVLAAFPAFMALLRSKAHRNWAFLALGAMPMLYAPLNLDGSFISWPVWPGHARGLTLTIVDPLALAICLRYARGRAEGAATGTCRVRPDVDVKRRCGRRCSCVHGYGVLAR